MNTAEYDYEARRRRRRSKYQSISAQMTFFDILLCEAVVCAVFIFVLIILKFSQNDIYSDVMLYIARIEAISVKDAFVQITEYIKNALF